MSDKVKDAAVAYYRARYDLDAYSDPDVTQYPPMLSFKKKKLSWTTTFETVSAYRYLHQSSIYSRDSRPRLRTGPN